jgi:hypothetical protein
MQQNNVKNKSQNMIKVLVLLLAMKIIIISIVINFPMIIHNFFLLKIKLDNGAKENLVHLELFYKFGAQTCNIITNLIRLLVIMVNRHIIVVKMELINGRVFLTHICLLLVFRICINSLNINKLRDKFIRMH